MEEKKGIIGTIAESARNVRAVNAEYTAEIKTDSKAVWDAAKKPDPSFAKVKEAKGFGGKVKAIGKNIMDGAAEASENNKTFRAEVQSGGQYRTVLKTSKELQNAMVGPAAIFNPYFSGKK